MSKKKSAAAEPRLRCLACNEERPLGPHFEGCPTCRQAGHKVPLEVTYDYASLGRMYRSDDFRKGGTLWTFAHLLPVTDEAARVTLGEGNTPLLPFPEVSGGARLYLKNEAQNPTGAFKDRLNSVCLSMARQFGFDRVVAQTTGNHGLSAAAYAAAAGLRCVVLCHEETPELLVNAIRAFGARPVVTRDRARLYASLVREFGWYPTFTMAPLPEIANPYGVEGYKSIAYEIFRQLGGDVPDAVFVPVGGGDGLYGVWKGFRELVELSAAPRAPRMFACQATGANPVVVSFRKGMRSVVELEGVSSWALSIREATAGMQTLRVLEESGGDALEASEEEILAALRQMASHGILAEPASAVSFACASRLASEGGLNGQRAVCILTSTALKWPAALARVSELTSLPTLGEAEALFPADPA